MPLDSTFWENEKRRLLAIFLPRLTQMAMAGMTNAARQAGISFDNTLYSKRAEAWARTYTDNLLIELGTTTEKFVGDKVADWIAKPDMTVGDLDAALTPAFGATRANAIAVTETTRAFVSGQEEAYKAEGITEWIWRTNKDEMVCKYCGGANNKVVKIGEPFGTDRKGKPVTKPPFHPRCRCWVAPKVSKDRLQENQNKQEKQVEQAIDQKAQAQINLALNTTNMPEKAYIEISKMEQQIAKQVSKETFKSVDADGNELLVKSGKRSTIDLTDDDIKKMKNSYITHNHPAGWDYPIEDPQHAGNSFSPSDIKTAISANLKELRAITPTRIYTIKPGVNGYPSEEDFMNEYKKAEEEVDLEGIDIASNPDQYMIEDYKKFKANYRHKIMEKVANKFGFIYTYSEHEY